MRTRLIVAFLCVMSMVAGVSRAGDKSKASGSTASPAVTATVVPGATADQGPLEPWIHPSMPQRAQVTLQAGFDLAVERMREVESCAELFASLGADPLEVLSSGLYFPVDSHRREVEVCGRNSATSSKGGANLAYTTVGGAPTFICRHFARVTTEEAAVVVIHEALHHGGLSEWPGDRMAMSSEEITEMVEAACEL